MSSNNKTNIDKEVIRALYKRAYLINVADTEKTISECLNELKNAPPGQENMLKMIQNSIPLLQAQLHDYKAAYDLIIQDDDIKMMQRFIDNLRRREQTKNNAEYAFLFEK